MIQILLNSLLPTISQQNFWREILIFGAIRSRNVIEEENFHKKKAYLLLNSIQLFIGAQWTQITPKQTTLHSSDGYGVIYWVTQKLLQIYTANHATFPIRIRKITAQICGNFWVTQYIKKGLKLYVLNFIGC